MSAIFAGMRKPQYDLQVSAPRRDRIRVVMIDDHSCIRDMMTTVLSTLPDMVMVGTAGNRRDGLAVIQTQKPDVLIQDICLGNEDGLAMVPEARRLAPHMKCIVVSGYDTNDLILRAMRYEVDGYIRKLAENRIILNAIRQVASGHKVWDESILKRLIEMDVEPEKKPGPVGIHMLTETERKVAHLIAEGMTNEEIGKELNFAGKTIRNKVSLIMEKLQVNHRARISALYVRSILCPPIQDMMLQKMVQESEKAKERGG